MWKYVVHPSFSDIDPLRHINNTRIPYWFETGREPVFALFSPELDLVNLPLIIARISVDYISQMLWGTDIEIHTHIKKIGRTSVTIYQEAYQKAILGAKGESILVHFDYVSQRSQPIPPEVEKKMRKHMVDPDNPNLRTRSGRLPSMNP